VVALLLGKVSRAAERGVELTVSDDTAAPELPIDTRDLVTIVGNLIDNAVEAALGAPPPRRVCVALRLEDGLLLVRVADSGAGIDPARAEDLFTRGWTTKNEAGHGIGLALVRQSVNRYHGGIEAGYDEALGGAALAVRLPAGRPAPTGAATAAS
jgi:two-component system CitB family sensor kinase